MPWLRELVDVPGDVETVAREIALRGFEVASVEPGRMPVIDFEITANRPDCLSHLGIAREASVDLEHAAARPPRPSPAAPAGDVAVDVDLDDAGRSARATARRSSRSRIGPSPAWLAERLEAAGVRPINNIVDVTNYVMLEIGPADARVRSRAAARAARWSIRRAAAGRDAADARRRRARARSGHAGHRRRRARGGGRRRDGRTRLRDSRRHDARSRSRARTSIRRRCAAPASGSA